MKTRRRTLQWASASVIVAFALGIGAAAATKPPAAPPAASDQATAAPLNGSLDSPDEKVNAIPVDNPNFAGGILGLNLRTIGVHCELTLAPNRVELKGTWYKGEASFPVEFKKQTAPSSRGR